MAEITQAPTGPQPAAYLVERALRRSRASVFFRFVLVIPHLIVVSLLGLTVIPVWLFGLLAALVLGRLPRWVRSYLGGVGAWYQRMQSYYNLITDQWPPFGFTDPTYPVQVTLPEATPIARWTVLLRIPLAPVAYVVNGFVSGGIGVFVIFAWFAGVFAGRTPRAVFDAIATVQRYQWRIYAYMGLLVPTFPWGVFGDGNALPTIPQGYGYPPAYGYPSAYGYPPASGYPPGFAPPYAPPAAPPAATAPADAPADAPAQPAPRPRPSPFPQPAAPPDPAPQLPSYPPPPGQPAAYPPAAPPPPIWAYAPMPPLPGLAGAAGTERREPGWYDGLISQGSKAILIIVVVLGGLQVVLNGVQLSRGGGLGFLQFDNVIRIDAADNNLDSVADDCVDETCAADLQAAAASLRVRVENAPSRGGRRERVLADLNQLDGDLAAEGTADFGLSEPVRRDLEQLDGDVRDLVKALIRG